jgi:hypothetical protein
MPPTPPEPENTPAPLPQQPPRIIQPISSETEILREANENIPPAAPAPVTQPSPTTPSSYQAVNPYETNLATEPLHPLATQPQPAPTPVPQPYTPSAAMTPPRPKKKRHLIMKIVGGIFLLYLGYVAYANLSALVSVDDLVQTDIQNTSYLRPKQWQPTGLGTSGYGAPDKKSGKFTALVSVKITPLSLGALSDSEITTFRSQILDTLTSSALNSAMAANGSPCKSDINLQKEADTSSTPTTTGLYTLTATCERSDGTVMIKMRGVIGKDGNVRNIGVTASSALWKINEAAYQKMLDSLQQQTTTS